MKIITLKIIHDNYQRNVLLNYFFKFISMFLGVISVRIILGYLGSTLYGLWVTIASIVSWMSSGDFGIGNGLRNKLADAYAKKKIDSQISLISSAFIMLSKISILLYVIMIGLSEVLIYTHVLQLELRIPMYVTSLFFCINLVCGLSQTIAYSYQVSWMSSMTNCLMQFLSVSAVWTLNLLNIKPNLVLFSIINGICTTIPNILLLLILNNTKINIWGEIRCSYDNSFNSQILNIGFQFFLLQLCSVVLFSTDNIIINLLFGSDMVTKYSIISKVYDVGASLFSVLLIALWSAVTLHISQNDIVWIKNKIKELLVIWLIFCLGVIVVAFGFNFIIRIWLGQDAIQYEVSLIFVFSLYCILTSGSGIFVNVLNGMGKVKLQLYLAVFESIINIPLSVILGKCWGMGILGVKLATLICVSISSIILPIQVIMQLKGINCVKSNKKAKLNVGR